MLEYLSTTNRRLFFVSFLLCSFILVLFYEDTNVIFNYGIEYNVPVRTFNLSDMKYLVYSPKCKMVNLEPFNKEARKFMQKEKYFPCRKLELLTYVTKNNNTATLHIDEEILPSYYQSRYTNKGISCCYSNVTRSSNSKDPDDVIKISPCVEFQNNVTITEEVVSVKCKDISFKKQVYENVHVVVKIKDNVHIKLENVYNATAKPLGVLIIGIDSISRLNFIRTMPNTYKYVTENNWLPLKGYNKMDDNTFPNLMAILSGFNQSYAYSKCNPRENGMLDKCPLLWYDYKKLGYVTAYAEDDGNINTFNYRKKGFTLPPTDYYFRPYILATEKLKTVVKDGMVYCTGPETCGERIMNAAKDFAITLKDYPQFGFFWMNSFSHNVISSPTGMDNKVRQLLEDLANNGVLENTILIFLSDHGIRFGEIRVTTTGWLEERLPFIYVSLPKWFQEKFPVEYQNFKDNEYKLTTPYDLHMTLQHILVLSGHNYTIRPSNACPECTSLFKNISSNRSCEEAGIVQHWCTCTGYKEVDLSYKVSNKIASFVINYIHNIIHKKKSDSKCAKYSLNKIIFTSLNEPLAHNNNTFVLITIETRPKAIYETTVMYKGNIEDGNYELSGDISRLDSYESHSKCVNDAYLKKYCYCGK